MHTDVSRQLSLLSSTARAFLGECSATPHTIHTQLIARRIRSSRDRRRSFDCRSRCTVVSYRIEVYCTDGQSTIRPWPNLFHEMYAKDRIKLPLGCCSSRLASDQ